MENNPIKFGNKNMDALKEAHSLLLSVLENYAKIKSLSNDDLQTIKQLINSQYQKRKIEYFLQEKMISYSNYFENTINMTFSQEINHAKDKTYSNMFYVKHTKELVSK